MKFTSRKFIGWVVLLIISTIALFIKIPASIIIAWGSFNLSIYGVFCGFNVWQKKIEAEKLDD